MPSASLRPLTDDPGVLARLTSSSVTQEGVLTDKQGIPWAHVLPNGDVVDGATRHIVARLATSETGSRPESSQHGHKHRKSYIRPVASANAELRAAIQNSSLTSQGTLVTSEGVAWAQADAGGHLIDAHGAVIGEIVDAEHPQPQQGDREAAPQTTLQIRPIASATPELIQAIQQSALRSDGVLVNAQGQPWAQANSTGQLVDGNGNVIGDVVQQQVAAPVLQIMPNPAASPAVLQMLQDSRLTNDGVLVNSQNVPWARVDASGQLVDGNGAVVGSVIQSGGVPGPQPSGEPAKPKFRFMAAEGLDPNVQKMLQESALDPTGGVVNAQGVVWARTNKFGHVFDETGKMIGEVERVSDDAQAENTSKTLAAAGHKLINCNNDALKNLIEHVWQWDPKTSFFFDDDGNVMARMNPDDLSVQLADLAVIGNVELAGGQPGESAFRIPPNCLVRLGHKVRCEDSVKERFEHSVLDGNGLLHYRAPGFPADADDVIGRLHPDQVHIVDPSFNIIGELIVNPDVPLPVAEPPETAERRIARCIGELTLFESVAPADPETPGAGEEGGAAQDIVVEIQPITIEMPPELKTFAEPDAGILEPDFDVKAWEKARDADKTASKPIVPLAYVRPKREDQSALVTAEIVQNVEMMFNVFRGKMNGAQFTFLFLDGLDAVLDKKTRSNLGHYLSAFVNLETLGLRKAGLRRLDKLNLAKLLHLNISYNLFADSNSIEKCVIGLPKLQVLDFTNNPIMNVKGFDERGTPLPEHPLWQVLLPKCAHLTHINGELIAPERRSLAMAKSKTKDVRNRRGWDVFLNALEQLPDMAKPEFADEFAPGAITEMNLANCGLTLVSLYSFVNLTTLVLKNNMLTSIEKCGFEKLQMLKRLDLSNNLLEKSRNYNNLNVLAALSSLQDLRLVGNKGLKTYKTNVIFITRHLPGTNRAIGLLTLDDEEISVEDRVAAIATIGKKKDAQAARWRLNLIKEFGHQQVVTVDHFESKVLALSLNNRFFDKIDVGKFVNVRILNLSNNNLSGVDGLQLLTLLRVVDISGNPSLNVSGTLKQLRDFNFLERVSIARSEAKVDANHIRNLLQTLIPKNKRLSVLEGKCIDFLDRMACFAKLNKKNKKVDIELYRANVALLTCATPLVGRSYDYDDVFPGKQYKPGDVTSIEQVSHYELKAVSLSEFANVKVVNLSHNALVGLPAGLSALQQLVRLDLRSNKINVPLAQIAQVADTLPLLELLYLRGNPIMRTTQDRLKLISLISRMKQVECNLRVIDTEVSLDERVDSWIASGGAVDQAETLRYRAAIFQRVKKGVAPNEVLDLNLSGTNISIVSLKGFINMQRLTLRSNRLAKLLGADIEKMTNLRVLDVRDNRISNVQDITSVVSQLPELTFLGLSGNVGLSANYRAEFIANCAHFTRVQNKLIFLDDAEVSIGEIMTSVRGVTEEFRFDLAVHRRSAPPVETVHFDRVVPIPERHEMLQLDLTGCELKFLDLSDFSSLHTLRLGNNLIETSALGEAALSNCKELRHLYLGNNQLAKIPKIVQIVSKLKHLATLDIVGNPCCPEPNKSDRHKVLKEWPDIEKRSFPLKKLDGTPVTVRERIKAASSLDGATIEDTRLDLTIFERQKRLPNGQPDANQKELDLSNSDLQVVKQAVDTFPNLQVIDLSDNSLRTLEGQGLHTLRHLVKLNLARNQFASLDSVLDWLSPCHALKNVMLVDSTTDGRTKVIDSYLDIVGWRLRGVQYIDGNVNKDMLEGMQLDSQRFLWKVAGVGPNQCINVDISNKNIPAEMFFYVISALAELQSVANLKSNGNQWNRSDKRILNYRQYIIYGLGRKLLVLDDEPISDDERLNAIEFVQKEEQSKKSSRVHKGGWVATREKAIVQHHKLTAKDARKQTSSGPNFNDNKTMASEMTEAGQGQSSIGANVEQAAQQVAKAAAAPLMAVTGTVLNKIEILINFLQTYSMVYVISLDLHITWPSLWLQIFSWLPYLSLDFGIVFPQLNLRSLIVFKFFVIMGIPLLFIAWFYLGASLNVDKWKARFDTNWGSTRAKAIACLVVAAILAFGVCLWWYPDNINRFQKGAPPSGEFIGLWEYICAPFVFIFVVWYLIAWRFRANCVGVPQEDFLRWWYTRTYFLRRVSLFALTVFFMPVARIIMEQFQCGPGGRLVIYPDRPCANVQLFPIQYCAFVFAVIYIIGVPLFFGRLISKATKMIDSHGYKDEEKAYKEIMDSLKKQARTDKEAKKKLRDAIEHLDTFWANEVALNPVPQTYLYGAYQRRFRYFKLFQMFQKLAIVCVSLFVPASAFENASLILSNAFVASAAVLAIMFRPFQDKYESVLEIASQVANTSNLLVAMLIAMGLLPGVAAFLLLFAFNGLALGVFAFSLLAAPIRFLLALREFNTQTKLVAEAAKKAADAEAAAVPALPAGLPVPATLPHVNLRGLEASVRHVNAATVAGDMKAGLSEAGQLASTAGAQAASTVHGINAAQVTHQGAALASGAIGAASTIDTSTARETLAAGASKLDAAAEAVAGQIPSPIRSMAGSVQHAASLAASSPVAAGASSVAHNAESMVAAAAASPIGQAAQAGLSTAKDQAGRLASSGMATASAAATHMESMADAAASSPTGLAAQADLSMAKDHVTRVASNAAATMGADVEAHASRMASAARAAASGAAGSPMGVAAQADLQSAKDQASYLASAAAARASNIDVNAVKQQAEQLTRAAMASSPSSPQQGAGGLVSSASSLGQHAAAALESQAGNVDLDSVRRNAAGLASAASAQVGQVDVDAVWHQAASAASQATGGLPANVDLDTVRQHASSLASHATSVDVDAAWQQASSLSDQVDLDAARQRAAGLASSAASAAGHVDLDSARQHATALASDVAAQAGNVDLDTVRQHASSLVSHATNADIDAAWQQASSLAEHVDLDAARHHAAGVASSAAAAARHVDLDSARQHATALASDVAARAGNVDLDTVRHHASSLVSHATNADIDAAWQQASSLGEHVDLDAARQRAAGAASSAAAAARHVDLDSARQHATSLASDVAAQAGNVDLDTVRQHASSLVSHATNADIDAAWQQASSLAEQVDLDAARQHAAGVAAAVTSQAGHVDLNAIQQHASAIASAAASQGGHVDLKAVQRQAASFASAAAAQADHVDLSVAGQHAASLASSAAAQGDHLDLSAVQQHAASLAAGAASQGGHVDLASARQHASHLASVAASQTGRVDLDAARQHAASLAAFSATQAGHVDLSSAQQHAASLAASVASQSGHVDLDGVRQHAAQLASAAVDQSGRVDVDHARQYVSSLASSAATQGAQVDLSAIQQHAASLASTAASQGAHVDLDTIRQHAASLASAGPAQVDLSAVQQHAASLAAGAASQGGHVDLDTVRQHGAHLASAGASRLGQVDLDAARQRAGAVASGIAAQGGQLDVSAAQQHVTSLAASAASRGHQLGVDGVLSGVAAQSRHVDLSAVQQHATSLAASAASQAARIDLDSARQHVAALASSTGGHLDLSAVQHHAGALAASAASQSAHTDLDAVRQHATALASAAAAQSGHLDLSAVQQHAASLTAAAASQGGHVDIEAVRQHAARLASTASLNSGQPDLDALRQHAASLASSAAAQGGHVDLSAVQQQLLAAAGSHGGQVDLDALRQNAAHLASVVAGQSGRVDLDTARQHAASLASAAAAQSGHVDVEAIRHRATELTSAGLSAVASESSRVDVNAIGQQATSLASTGMGFATAQSGQVDLGSLGSHALHLAQGAAADVDVEAMRQQAGSLASATLSQAQHVDLDAARQQAAGLASSASSQASQIDVNAIRHQADHLASTGASYATRSDIEAAHQQAVGLASQAVSQIDHSTIHHQVDVSGIGQQLTGSRVNVDGVAQRATQGAGFLSAQADHANASGIAQQARYLASSGVNLATSELSRVDLDTMRQQANSPDLNYIIQHGSKLESSVASQHWGADLNAIQQQALRSASSAAPQVGKALSGVSLQTLEAESGMNALTTSAMIAETVEDKIADPGDGNDGSTPAKPSRK